MFRWRPYWIVRIPTTRGTPQLVCDGFWKSYTHTYHHAKFQKLVTKCTIFLIGTLLHVTGFMLSNYTQITRMFNFHPHFRETVILGNFYKIHDEKMQFFVVYHNKSYMYHMKPAYFGQCSCCLNIDKNNYPEETELDTNPSLTLARTLTLSTGERNFAILRPVIVTTPRF